MVKETARTLLYVGIAVVSVGIAFATHYSSIPSAPKEYEKIGEPFFSDDFDPNSAKSLKVFAFDDEAATIKEFNVEAVNGKWLIPSHHSYPADAKDRLSKTATSVIGLTRDALVSRLASDHHLYDVLDPSDMDSAELQGRGSRIIIARADGTVLTDLIIGKQIEGRPNHYYVRVPTEKETYICKVELDLSSKFSDWIEEDLLKIERGDLRDIVINKYSIDETKGAIVGQEVNYLSKATANDDWKLKGLKNETEETNKADITKLVGNLDDLKIVGVRPKPQGLNPDLSLDPKIKQNPLLLQSIRSSLANAGFFLAQDQNGNRVMVSNEGELTAGTKDGIVYNIRFGEIFSGSSQEVETGLNKESESTKEDKKTEDKNSKEGDKKEKSSKKVEEKKEDTKKDEKKKNRYLFVSVKFDSKLLGPAPTKPVEPKKPAEAKKKKEDKKAEPKKEDKPAKDKKAEDKKAEDKKIKEGDKKEPSKKEEIKPDPQKLYEAAKLKYDADLKKYESDIKKHEESITAGQKRVDDLNRRFGNWYYVISAESFEEMRLSRADLVKPKEKKKGDVKPEDLLKNLKLPPTTPAPQTKKPVKPPVTKKEEPAKTPPPSELEKKEPSKPSTKDEKKETKPEKRETKKLPLDEIKTEEPPPPAKKSLKTEKKKS